MRRRFRRGRLFHRYMGVNPLRTHAKRGRMPTTVKMEISEEERIKRIRELVANDNERHMRKMEERGIDGK